MMIDRFGGPGWPTFVADIARLSLLPATQKAAIADKDVEAALGLRWWMARLPGAWVVNYAALPAGLVALAVASRYDTGIAECLPRLPRWARAGAGWCFAASPFIVH